EEQMKALSPTKRKIDWKALNRRKNQFQRVARVLHLCGTDLPANLLPIIKWYEPRKKPSFLSDRFVNWDTSIGYWCFYVIYIFNNRNNKIYAYEKIEIFLRCYNRQNADQKTTNAFKQFF